MDSTNGGARHGEGHSSFFNQRGAANDGPKPPIAQEPSRPASNDPEAARRMNDARKFEDEKQRITANCFGKLDERGVPYQTYITHIQVHENSSSPSEPPPLDAPESQRKLRIIIIAVKNSGRVMMHKARENEDTTYQIGKTWPLEELQVIETFATSQATTEEERQRSLRAGPLGFALTLGKPYFWRARSLLEKGHFILGLIKIYSKYTGNMPQLIGFEPREREKIMSTIQIPSAAPLAQRAQQPAPLQPQSRNSPQQREQQQKQQQQQQQQMQRQVSDYSSVEVQRSVATGFPGTQRAPSPLRQQSAGVSDGQPSSRQRGSSEQFLPPSSVNAQLRTQVSQDVHIRQGPLVQKGPSPTSHVAPLRSQPSRQILTEAQKSQRPPFMEQLSNAANTGTVYKDIQSSRSELPVKPSVEPGPPPAQSSGTTPLSISTARLWRPDGQTTTTTTTTLQNPALANLLNSLSIQTTPQSFSPNDPTQALPERRRPPLQDSTSFRSEVENSPTKTIPFQTQPPQKPTIVTSSEQVTSQAPAARLQGVYAPSTAIPPVSTEQQSERKKDLVDHPQPLSISIPEARPDTNSRANNVPVTPTDTPENNEPAVPSPGAEGISKEEPKFRPGLGPMMGKKTDVANKFRKAATAASAFKPRAGGAGERLLKSKMSPESESVTKVVPAPTMVRETSTNGTDAQITENMTAKDEVLVAVQDQSIPQSPNSDENGERAPSPVIVTPIEGDKDKAEESHDLTVSKKSRESEPVKLKRRSNVYANSLAAIDIDATMMEGRDIDYEDILADFGWEKTLLQSKQIESMQTRIRREIGRLEVGSWLGHSEHKDDRVEIVGKLLEKAINECDEMERLLTLYSVELATLNDDVAYIEAQSQGLQVQTANQKLLQNELEKLMSTVSIDSRQLEPLKQSSLQDLNGLAEIEQSLLLLYQALRKISPSLVGHEERAVSAHHGEQTLSSMRALQENKEFYAQEAQHFLSRLRKYAEPTFGMAFSRTKDSISRNRTSATSSVRLEVGVHDLARGSLWQYSPLMLFAKEVNPDVWQQIMATYQGQARLVYQDELQENMMAWKKLARKYTGEEQDALFTSSQEKENDNLGGTARKLTVKRSQTLARTFRTGSAEKRLALDKGQDSRLSPFESWSGALEESTPLIMTEQNFVIDFFHATSTQSMDFAELVTATRPNERRGTNLLARKPAESDRSMARKVSELLETVFGSWHSDMQNLIDWAISADPFQGIGILCALERKQAELENGNQEYIIRTLRKLQERLTTSFSRFVESQIRAIEETKVKIKKRRGVINFIKVFPNFSILVENMLPPADGAEKLELRRSIDEAYDKICRAMFESLKTIAKEMPMGPVQGSGADPEDKEALNYHILLIENMYHFYTELEERGDLMLGQWRGKAMLEMSEHQELYVSAVIRRPLGKLLDFVEAVENSRSTSATASHSRSAFKKALGSYDSKEVRRGIETLRKRIEKHFGEGDDHAISQKLISQLLGECERRYEDVLDRTQRIAGEKYDGSVEVEFSKGDISQGFKR